MAVANDHPVALAEQPLHGNAQITITLELILSVSCNEAQLVTMLLSIKEFFDTSSPIVILVFFFTNANILNGDINSKLVMIMQILMLLLLLLY